MNCVKLIFCFVFSAAVASAADALPRVLILGDNLYKEPAKQVAKQLQDRVEIVWKNAGDTTSALARVEDLLGEGQWDVIYFNFGLADLLCRDPNTITLRSMSVRAGGVPLTNPEIYENNLRHLLKRFQATGAKLIWASTTPIRSSALDIYVPGSEIEYNRIAAKLMAAKQITINDMHAHFKNQIDMQRPSSNDPFEFDKKPIHTPLESAILKSLNLPPSK